MIGLYPNYYAVEHCQLTLQLKEIREDFVIYTHLLSYVNSLLSSSVNITPLQIIIVVDFSQLNELSHLQLFLFKFSCDLLST